MTAHLALKRYKHAHRALLYLYQNKPCPQLDWGVLRADWFSRVLKEKGRYREVRTLMYLEDDLKRLKAPVHPGQGKRSQMEKQRSQSQAGMAGQPPSSTSDPNAEEGAHRKPSRARGRPKGRTEARVQREREMLEGWDRGEYGTNMAAAGKAHDIDRSDARKIIFAHEQEKRRK